MASVLQLGPASICQILVVVLNSTMTTIPNRMLQLISAWRQRRSATRSDECDECAGNQFPPHCSLLPSRLPPWSCCHTCSFVENMRFLFLGFPTTLNNCIINERVSGTDRRTDNVAFTPAQWSTKWSTPSPLRGEGAHLSRCVKQARNDFQIELL